MEVGVRILTNMDRELCFKMTILTIVLKMD